MSAACAVMSYYNSISPIQWVVTCILPIKMFTNGIKIFNWQKLSLIVDALIFAVRILS